MSQRFLLARGRVCTSGGGWALGRFDEQARDQATEALLASDTFLLGRRTYEIIEKAWSGNTGPYAEAMTGDAADTVRELKERPGRDIVLYGSFTLLRTMIRHKLLDVLNLGVHPVTIGAGERLAEGLKLELVSATPSRTGVVTLTYAA